MDNVQKLCSYCLCPKIRIDGIPNSLHVTPFLGQDIMMQLCDNIANGISGIFTNFTEYCGVASTLLVLSVSNIVCTGHLSEAL
jgi:hypothetical protein